MRVRQQSAADFLEVSTSESAVCFLGWQQWTLIEMGAELPKFDPKIAGLVVCVVTKFNKVRPRASFFRDEMNGGTEFLKMGFGLVEI